MRTPTRFRAETKYTESTEQKANVNQPMMAAVGNGDGVTAAVAGRANWFHIRLLDDDNRLTQAYCQLALSYDDLIYVAKAKDRKLTYYEFVAFIQDVDGETEPPICPKFAQVVYVSENSCQFTTVGEAITHINALATGPLATRLFLIKVQAGNFAETGDVTIPQYVSLEGVGEASEIEMGANTLFLDSDTSLESLVVESSDPVAAIGVIAEDNVVMRDVRCIQTAVAGTPDCFYLNANTNVYLYNCIAEVAQNGAGYHVVNDDAVMYLCTALADTYSATTYGFQVSGVASVELHYCVADDDTNFGDGLHLDAAGLTCTTRWCTFAGADDDVNTGATSTWQHFMCQFDPDNSTIGGTETPLITGKANFDDVVTFEDGFTFDGASAANIVTVPDAVNDAMEIVDSITGDEYLGVRTAAQKEVVFNEDGVDIDFTVEAAGVADAFQVRGADGQITLGILGAGAVQSSAAGVLSSGALPLTDLASYARGSIIRGGAADWEAYAAETAGFLMQGDGADVISAAFDWDAYSGAPGANMVHSHQAGPEGAFLDHGAALIGLADDDHIQYLLHDGTRGLSGAWNVGAHLVTFGAGIVVSAGNVGVGIAPGTDHHLYVHDNAVNTTATYYGAEFYHEKTAGVTDTADNFYGLRVDAVFNQAGGVLGYMYGGYFLADLDAGTLGDAVPTNRELVGSVSGVRIDGGTLYGTVYGGFYGAWLNTGSVLGTGDVFGLRCFVDIDAGMTAIAGDVFGCYISVDDDLGAAGTVYMLYLSERTGVDYGIYQSGTADNYFGGDVGIRTPSPDAALHVVQSAAAGTDNYAIRIQNPTNVANVRVGIGFLTNAHVGALWDGAAIQGANDGVTGAAHLLFGTVINNVFTERIRFDSSGHVYPLTVKAQDLGLETNEWRTVHCNAVDTTCGRLVQAACTCPVCGTEMVRGAGTLFIGGEESDYALAHCPDCGCAAMEEIKHLTPEKLREKRPVPKVILEDVQVHVGGSRRHVSVYFRYGEDAVDVEGMVVEQAVRNATRLGEYEVDEFLAMNDKDSLAFLLALGRREWDSREETRLAQEEAGDLRLVVNPKVRDWLGKDLLKEAALPN